MNRAFLIIMAPTLLVFLLGLGLGWGLRVSWSVGVLLLVIACIALLIRRGKGRPAARP